MRQAAGGWAAGEAPRPGSPLLLPDPARASCRHSASALFSQARRPALFLPRHAEHTAVWDVAPCPRPSPHSSPHTTHMLTHPHSRTHTHPHTRTSPHATPPTHPPAGPDGPPAVRGCAAGAGWGARGGARDAARVPQKRARQVLRWRRQQVCFGGTQLAQGWGIACRRGPIFAVRNNVCWSVWALPGGLWGGGTHDCFRRMPAARRLFRRSCAPCWCN